MNFWHFIVWITIIVFFINGIVHYLYILGRLKEDLNGVPSNLASTLIYYSRFLAVLDLVAAYGLAFNKSYGFIVAILIAITQIPSHGLVIFFKSRQGVRPELFRYVDIALSIVLLILFSFGFLTLKLPL